MNHRERVLNALRHIEPDRIPVDLGATQVSGIMAVTYQELRRYYGLPAGITRVQDVYQMTAMIEPDLREMLGVDTFPVWGEPQVWRQGILPNGGEAEFPANFVPELMEDGSQVVFDKVGNITLKMPADGLYYDNVYIPLANASNVNEIEKCMDEIEQYDEPEHLDKDYAELAKKAKDLRENTDYFLVGYFGGHILYAAQNLRGWQTFLMDLLINPEFAEALMDKILDAHLRRFDRFIESFGQYVHLIEFDEDLGMQDRPLMKPSLYRQLLKPRQKQLFSYAKSRSDAFLLLHTDGSVAQFFPDFIEMGIDAVNPIQVSAADMDTQLLKREYGADISFWGGGCDSQTVLPMGSPQDVEDEVKRRIDHLSPGGGFVFAPIHNIQANVPVENIAAVFKTVRDYGLYR
jgi:uroporphyrinogen decarboxylase